MKDLSVNEQVFLCTYTNGKNISQLVRNNHNCAGGRFYRL